MPAGMEVRLDAMHGYTPPPDTFVAMRVGDVQKQSRFDKTRTYRFPDPGDTRGAFGRIEVFKRIGSLTVNLDRSSQECQVPCHYPDFDELKMKLNVKSGETWERPATTEKKSKAKQRMDDAQLYLAKYSLEELLADAMREVIRNKPDSPHKFLSNYIMDRAQSGFLPVIKDAKKAEPEPLPIQPSRGKMAQLTRSEPPPLPTSPNSRGFEKLPPIQHRESKKSLPTSQAPPQPTKAVQLARLPAAAATPVAQPQDPKIAVSPPEWLLPANHQASTKSAPPQAILPLKSYYMANFAGSVAESVCLNLFPSAKPPEAKAASEMLRLQLRGSLFQATRTGDFERAMRSVKGPPNEETHQPKPFKYLPSVGTWCATRLPEEELPMAKPDFKRLPSVCTWIAPVPCRAGRARVQAAAVKTPEVIEAPFRHRPSVGTWLTKKPETVERPWYYQDVDGEHSEYIHKLQDVIAEKDLELEKLKAKLAMLQEKGPELQMVAPDSSAKALITGPKGALAVAPFRSYYVAHFKPWKGAEAICQTSFKPKGVASQATEQRGPAASPPAYLLPTSSQAQALCNGAPAVAPITSFQKYFTINFKSAKESTSLALSLFPSKVGPPVKAKEERGPAVSPPAYLLPCSSQGQALCKGAPATAPITNFTQYCITNFKGAGQSTSSVLSLFPSKASAASAAPAAKPNSFTQLPSVGSWIGTRSQRRMRKEVEAAKKDATPPPQHWMQQASVGTWLAHRWVAPATTQTQPSILERSRTSLLRMPQEDLISNYEEEIRRRDREIEELKQKVPA